MSQRPTKKQQRALDFLRSYHQRSGACPSVREVASALRVGAGAAHQLLDRLERDGWILRHRGRARSIEILNSPHDERRSGRAVPIVGRIAAGTPFLATENYDGEVLVDEGLAGGKQLFALRVAGDSMIGAQIADGDIVIAEQRDAANHGDIVVARLGDEATVKRLIRHKGSWALKPENPRFRIKPIHSEEVSIQGKVVQVRRSIR